MREGGTMVTEIKSGFYATQDSTYYVAESGTIWVVQSDDRDCPFRFRGEQLPAVAQPCGDLMTGEEHEMGAHAEKIERETGPSVQVPRYQTVEEVLETIQTTVHPSQSIPIYYSPEYLRLVLPAGLSKCAGFLTIDYDSTDQANGAMRRLHNQVRRCETAAEAIKCVLAFFEAE
jgi:hypothetical protein